ncbi:MAG: hypothetical protein FJ387_12390 [Verrucomicrobia bacterium]|nr:hypothetical protein [Verrucomicrobiota bacterium]
MNPRVWFVITSDPRSSPRPAEAVRIAAGLGAWGKLEVTLYLRDAAVLTLLEDPDELLDEDNFRRYWPIVREWGRPVYVQQGNAHLAEVGQAPVPWEELDDAEWARRLADATYVLRF